MNASKYYTVAEVAKMLNYSPKRIYDFIKDGTLESHRPARKLIIPDYAIEAFLKSGKDGVDGIA